MGCQACCLFLVIAITINAASCNGFVDFFRKTTTRTRTRTTTSTMTSASTTIPYDDFGCVEDVDSDGASVYFLSRSAARCSVETINMIEVAGGEMTACDPSKEDAHRERRERFAVRNIYLKETILLYLTSNQKFPPPTFFFSLHQLLVETCSVFLGSLKSFNRGPSNRRFYPHAHAHAHRLF